MPLCESLINTLRNEEVHCGECDLVAGARASMVFLEQVYNDTRLHSRLSAAGKIKANVAATQGRCAAALIMTFQACAIYRSRWAWIVSSGVYLPPVRQPRAAAQGCESNRTLPSSVLYLVQCDLSLRAMPI